MIHAFLLSFALAMASLQGSTVSAGPAFGFPAECRVGQNCLIQKLVDHDAGPGRRDYRCGVLTTNGHDGTDIRLRTMADMRDGVAVLAAAAGTVLRTRDGEPDIAVSDRAALDGKDAGNAVVIDHGDGWQTQYSHLRQGSITVRPGQRLMVGDRIGLIGLSGNTEFPHLHFTVRRYDRAIDPFVGDGPLPDCGAGGGTRGLWAADTAAMVGYQPAATITAGLASVVPAKAVVDRDPPPALAGRHAPLILWVDAMGARAGDRQQFSITGPNGQVIHDQQSEIVDGGLSWFAYSGRRAPTDGWTSGRYVGRYLLRRGDRAIAGIETHGTIQ